MERDSGDNRFSHPRVYSFLADQLEYLNGFPIQSSGLEIPLISIIGPPDDFFSKHAARHHVIEGETKIIGSEASALGVYAYVVDSSIDVTISAGFSEEEMRSSSGNRELIAVTKFLSAMSTKKLTDQHRLVYWLSDSMNLVSFLTKGSSVPSIQN